MADSEKKKKILAVASIGGHWVQLLRITAGLAARYDICYVSTNAKCNTMLAEGSRFYAVADFSRWDAWRALPASFAILKILLKERPKCIVSTGATPGLLTIMIGRMLGIKTIWIDSVANVQTMSACGKIASKCAKHVYTQWPNLAHGRVKFCGNIFGEKN
jgi:UDP-N-acetylglucosamine:LPS N-acetylglucosamine transferase